MDPKQKKFKLMAQLAIGGAIAFAVAPAIFMVVKGIIGLAIAAVIGGVCFALTPAVSTWLTNMKFKALKSVIQTNPVETLQSQREVRAQELQNFRVALNTQTVELERFRVEVQHMQRDYPDEAPRYVQQLQDFEKLLAFRVDQYKKAKVALVKFEDSIRKAERIYRMSLASQKAGAAMNANEDFMSKFKEEVAFDAIEEENIKAIAALKMAMDDDKYVLEQINTSNVAQHAVAYDPQGRVMLGDILKPVEVKVTNK